MLYPLSYGGSGGDRRSSGCAEVSRSPAVADRPDLRRSGLYGREMTGVLAAVGLLVLLALVIVWMVRPVRGAQALGGRPALPPRDRARMAEAVAAARWAPAHDEVEGQTRVLLRRSCPGLDGLPVVLEERVFATFPADDAAWEARFTEAMAGARFRCGYLNAEEGG